jgi:N-acetylmuramoyl-L-alanine amidase
MKIINHLLYFDDGSQVRFVRSPNFAPGIQPEYVVMHYTAGPSVKAAVNTLISKSAQVSSHLVIGRDGSIVQLVPFNMVAWHAGVSSWEGRSSLNNFSFGIELDNNGRLSRTGSKWSSIFKQIIPDAQLIVAKHKNGRGPFGWQTYTDAQLATAVEACRALFLAYQLRDVMGHDDIAPQRKSDPGPAFPMDSFRAQVKDQLSYSPAVYTATTNLSIRDAASSLGKLVIPGMLPKGVQLNRFEIQNGYMRVKALDEIDGIQDLEGWVVARYVQKGMGLKGFAAFDSSAGERKTLKSVRRPARYPRPGKSSLSNKTGG